MQLDGIKMGILGSGVYFLQNIVNGDLQLSNDFIVSK